MAHSEVAVRWPAMSMFTSVGSTTSDNDNCLDDMITDLPGPENSLIKHQSARSNAHSN
jgi:hypothetical protein